MRISDWSSDVCSSDLDYLALREQIRDEVTTQRLRNKEVDSRVVVTEQDVDAFLASASANSDNEYRLSDIPILVPDGASQKAREQPPPTADELLKRLKAADDFAKLATATSNRHQARKSPR